MASTQIQQLNKVAERYGLSFADTNSFYMYIPLLMIEMIKELDMIHIQTVNTVEPSVLSDEVVNINKVAYENYGLSYSAGQDYNMFLTTIIVKLIDDLEELRSQTGNTV